ncbi:PREDICTED: transient receptor potential protein-like [Nicrophorus vespilloides]|uniref:Transient receptor potential protein-like n=1 Tax=Nicrophorus vespilloides TaxID=110193 RepID=A0ABM1NCC3_NICVS|nr:PREDICTED: transient receptor potential protein-like [Nicrophorus vespilloides]
MKSGESQQNLIASETMNEPTTPMANFDINDLTEKPLGPIEKTYLLHAERGDCATVKRLIRQYANNPEELDINCVDPLNRSALTAAIENENMELIKLLVDEKIQVKDALLQAIKEEYIEAVEFLLQYEEEHHVVGQPYSWESVDRASSTFTSDITPLILASHKNNYEIIKILLDRGASLPMPHDVKCGCDECVESNSLDSLRHSRARINAYRALSASSLIALSSKDPVLTAFELSWELRKLSRMETEFRADYNEMRTFVQGFATTLLDHVRTSSELEILLNYDPEGDVWEPGEHQSLERLKLAIKYKQKMFVAHPSVQQLLAAIWYEGLPGFRRKSLVGQLVQVAHLGAMFPIYCTIYMMKPESEMGLFLKKPFVKFICHSTSYAYFLMLLGAASQRVEVLAIQMFGNEWMQEMVAEWRRKERGAGPGIAECGVILYMISLIWAEIRTLWTESFSDYLSDLWNIVDFITLTFYMTWLALRMSSIYTVWREASQGRDPWYPREQWESFDPMLLSEGAFAAGMIFSFLKLVHIFSVNPHLGPLQISLGRMIIDIVKFFFIYTLVLFAFGCGLNQLLWYYAELEKSKCYHLPSGLPDFDNNDMACSIWRRYANLFETSQSLFWASFGLVDLVSFELTGIKGFTRFWALLMFGSYSVINVIVLLNMLIAMMSNSYQIISERSDSEWKFARSKLWISYFDDGDTLPPPFNIFPRPKNLLMCRNKDGRTKSFKRRTKEKERLIHEKMTRMLVRRFVMAEQRKRDDFGITEDDVLEIRQDISKMRYDLLDIFKLNGMQTPNLSSETELSGKKGKVMERRLLKDFHIGIVEQAVSEAMSASKEPKDIFGHLAKVIGRGSKNKSNKKDWNSMVRKGTIKDQIGTTKSADDARIGRQSLRKHILSNVSSRSGIDQNKLLEYNPKLSEVPRGARTAYAKFMTKKIQQDYTEEDDTAKAEGVAMPGKSVKKPAPPKPSVKFKHSVDSSSGTVEETDKKSDAKGADGVETKITGSGDTAFKSAESKSAQENNDKKTDDKQKTEDSKESMDVKPKDEKPKEENPKEEKPKEEKPKEEKVASGEKSKVDETKEKDGKSKGEKIDDKSEEAAKDASKDDKKKDNDDKKVKPKEDKAGTSKDDKSKVEKEVKAVLTIENERPSTGGKSKLSGKVRTGWI